MDSKLRRMTPDRAAAFAPTHFQSAVLRSLLVDRSRFLHPEHSPLFLLTALLTRIRFWTLMYIIEHIPRMPECRVTLLTGRTIDHEHAKPLMGKHNVYAS